MLFKRPTKTYPDIPYNLEALEFLNRNNITIVDISQITEQIVEPRDVDSILEEKAITSERVSTNISIADILGYEYPRKRDIIESISEFFDSKKDGYHTRSISMLKYTPDDIMSGLSSSFIVEPIRVREVEPGKCFIAGNGMHRFTVLKLMYLIEKYRGKDPEELKKKYTFPVILNKIDKLKTYCAYIISILNDNIYICSELDDNYRKTGKAEVRDKTNKTKKSLNDEELIIYITEILRDCSIDLQELLSLAKHVENNPSFYDFLNTHFKDLLMEVERFIEFKKNCKNPTDLCDYKINNKKEDTSSWTL